MSNSLEASATFLKWPKAREGVPFSPASYSAKAMAVWKALRICLQKRDILVGVELLGIKSSALGGREMTSIRKNF